MKTQRLAARVGVAVGISLCVLAGSAFAQGSLELVGRYVHATTSPAFGTNLRVNDDATTSDQFTEWSTEKALVSKGNRVYAVWIDFRDSQSYWETDVYLATSQDGGQTFGPNIRVNSAPIGAVHRNGAAIALDGRSGNIYVAWAMGYGSESDIYFARSVDDGSSFEQEIRIAEETAVTYQVGPSLAADNDGNVYVVWRDHRNGTGCDLPSGNAFSKSDIFLTKSTDAGVTFGANVKVSAGCGPRLQDMPVVDVDDANTIYVAWEDGDDRFDGDSRIRVTSSRDGGVTFGPERVVSTLWGSQVIPSMAATGEGIVYVTYSSGGSIDFSKTLDGGITFSEPTVVATGERASMDVDEVTGAIYVGWQADDSIFAAVSEDYGKEFVSLGKVHDSDNAARCPRTAADGGRVHVTWDDDRNGNEDIYYAGLIMLSDPAELIARLIEDVRLLGLPSGIEQSLIVKLDAAGRAIASGFDRAATWLLHAFVDRVWTQRGQHISDADADALIRVAEAIIAMLELVEERVPRRPQKRPRQPGRGQP